MTKTLTEQWREGTLPNNYYWCRILDNEKDVFMQHLIAGHFEYSPSFIKEVLASVPTYAEFMDLMSNLEYIDKYRELVSKTEQLEKKLAIATKALEDMPEMSRAQRALREMEGVK